MKTLVVDTEAERECISPPELLSPGLRDCSRGCTRRVLSHLPLPNLKAA